MALSIRQQDFVNEYLKCQNATLAAKLAGYKGDENSLAVTGHRLLRNAKIKEIIQLRFQESSMTSDEVIKRLADMARNDIAPFVDIEKPTDLQNEKYQGKTHLVKKIKTTRMFTKAGDEIVTTELELYDAKSALDSLAKYHNLFRDTQVNIDIDYSTLTNEQLQRIANGEDPLIVASSQSQSRTGAEAATGETEEPMAD